MAPWVHLHVWPNGDVFPCCTSDISRPLGNLKNSSLAEIWNNEKTRALRRRIIEGTKSAECTKCYELENIGAPSNRTGVLNKLFAHHAPSVGETKSDGTFDRLNLAYVDIRFSNLCNFRCRTCGPDLSSGWRKDIEALDKSVQYPPSISLSNQNGEVLDELLSLIDTTEEIYFAGGEPLLMEEHYRLLTALIERGLTRVRLRYNTNFSNLAYRGHDFLSLWKKFENVTIDASLDGMHERGEYLRKGQEWKRVVSNRERMLKEAPGIQFRICFTLSLMNCFHVTDFHEDWVGKGFVAPDQFLVNLLQFPEIYRTQLLPAHLKEKLREKYADYIERVLKPLGVPGDAVKRGLESTLQYTFEQDRADLLPKFKQVTSRLDTIRGEKFADVFPELAELMR